MQRRWANLSLLIALGLFMLSLVFRGYPASSYVSAGALASLAGGIADWFAVTALFRHPLGLKWLPHTSIIAKNRDRIIEAIVVMVQNELLAVDFITQSLERLNVVDRLIDWLERSATLEGNGVVSGLVRELLDLLPIADLADEVGRYIARSAEGIALSDLGVGLIRWLIQSGKDRELFQFLAREAKFVLNTVEFTEDMEQRLKAMIEEYSQTTTKKIVLGILESLGTIDYRELSGNVREHLIAWIDSDAAFEQFELGLVRLMMALRDDPKVRNTIEQIKDEVVREVPWARILARLVDQFKQAAEDGRLHEAMGGWQQAIADLLRADPNRRAHLEELIKSLAVSGIRRYHPVIGRLVRDNLQSMDDREWIDKLEWYVGRDLQWIRINGAMVGGVVGVAIEALLHLAGIPL